jgi:hypothetical protein
MSDLILYVDLKTDGSRIHMVDSSGVASSRSDVAAAHWR